MMKLIITGHTIKDIKEQIIEAAQEFLAAQPIGAPEVRESHATTSAPSVESATTPEPEPTPVIEITEVPEPPAPKKKGAGRPKSAAKEVLDMDKIAAAARKRDEELKASHAPRTREYEKTECIELLTKLGKADMHAAREALSRFNVSRFSDMDEKDHSDFGHYCSERLAGKPVI